jgi:hypothetical protein
LTDTIPILLLRLGIAALASQIASVTASSVPTASRTSWRGAWRDDSMELNTPLVAGNYDQPHAMMVPLTGRVEVAGTCIATNQVREFTDHAHHTRSKAERSAKRYSTPRDAVTVLMLGSRVTLIGRFAAAEHANGTDS